MHLIASIHGLVYMIIGGVVLAMSLNLGEEFKVFIYVGAVMLGWGLLKVFWKVLKYRHVKKKVHHHMHKAHEELAKHNPHHNQKHMHKLAQSHQGKTYYQKHGSYFCIRCGTQLRRGDRFCAQCGSKL